MIDLNNLNGVLPNGALINNVAYFYQSTNPTTRIDGSALLVGDLFYSTVTNCQYFWNGILWLTTADFFVCVGQGHIATPLALSTFPRKTDHGIYLVDGFLTGQPNGAGNNNSNTDFWRAAIQATNLFAINNSSLNTASLGTISDGVQFFATATYNIALSKTFETFWVVFGSTGSPKNIIRASISIRCRHYL